MFIRIHGYGYGIFVEWLQLLRGLITRRRYDDKLTFIVDSRLRSFIFRSV